MAKIIVSCPKCGGKLAAPEGAERFRCPTCKTVLAAPKQPGGEPSVTDTSTMAFALPVTPPAPVPAPAPAPAPAAPQKPKAEAGATIDLSELSERPAKDGELAAGQRLGGYTISRLIGHGGMGAVYEAIQEGLKRRVAIKVLPEVAGRDTAFLVNFKRDAQAVAKLNHPNIVQIFDIDQDRGYHFFSMEYVDGESLADRLEREKRLPLSDAVQIAAQAAVALDHAYERMLVHRDLKPSNILLAERGGVKVADLGLSKSLEETSVGVVRGSHGGPLYMAPEFAKNPKLADCRSDIYALGAVLFHALTGRPPFTGANLAEIILKHAEAPFPSARALAPEIPPSVEALLKKMCAKDPAERFQTYDELLEAMQALLKSTSIRLPLTDSAAQTAVRPRRRGRLPLIVGAAAVVAAALVVAIYLLLPRGMTPEPQAVAPTTNLPVQPPKVQPSPPEKPAPAVLPEEKGKGEEPVETPKAKTEEPTTPKEKEPEPKAKEEPPQPKEEEPKKGDAPAWEARLAEGRKGAEALAAESQFAKALAALDELVKDNENLDLQKGVDDAKAAIQERAAKAFEGVIKKVRDLAAQGKLDEARAALQAVVDTFGTDNEVAQAKAGADSIAQYTEGRSALVKGAEEARTAADATERRAAQLVEAAKSFLAVHGLLDNWQLEQAAAALGKLKFDDPGLAAQVEQRKAAAEALAAFRDVVAQQIKAANPRLTKGVLKIPGLNGELADADKEGIVTVVTGGGGREQEKLSWAKLTDASVERIARQMAKPGDASHQLAVALWYRLTGNEQKAASTFARAGELGAKVDALTEAAPPPEKTAKEAQAARTLAESIKLCLDGRQKEAEAALAGYKEKFADTDYYAAHERLFEVASAFKPFRPPGTPEVPTPPVKPPPKEPEPKQPQPKQPQPKQPEPKGPEKPGDEEKAKECYEKAVAAFRVRQFEECKKSLDALRDASPKSPLLADKKLNPTVETMQKATDARGQYLKVASAGKDAYPSLEKALAAIEKPRASIDLDAGVATHGTVVIPARNTEGLVLRGVGDKRPRLDGGVKREFVLQLEKDAKDLWLDNLEFTNAKAAIDVNINDSFTLRDCVAVTNIGSALAKHPVSKVAIVSSILRLDKLVDTPARYSAIQLPEKATVEGGEQVGCILVGNAIEFRKVTLTDCLVIGDVVLGSDAKLNHVTVAGHLVVPEDARGVAITDSIAASLAIGDPKVKGKAKDKRPEAIVTLKNTCLYAQTRALPRDQVKMEELTRVTRLPFEDPHGPDFRLPKNSPLRDKASDQKELGSRFPTEMLDMLRLVARRYAQVLRPLPPAHR